MQRATRRVPGLVELLTLLKALHVSLALVSGAGFALRGAWMLRDSRLLEARWVRTAPHAVDTLLLASDALFDNLRTDEIVERIRKGPIESSADRLSADAQRRMTEPTPGEPSKPDDLSFVIFRRRRA